MKVTLHYVEFCANSFGIWDRDWSLTEADAEKERARIVDDLGSRERDEDELDGSYGDVFPVKSIEVELTHEGLLSFARNYAVDDSA